MILSEITEIANAGDCIFTNKSNHNSRTLPYGALLTKVFSHFRVKVSEQRNQYISKGFSITTIKKGISIDSTEEEHEDEEEGQEESSQHMEVDGNFEVPPP